MSSNEAPPSFDFQSVCSRVTAKTICNQTSNSIVAQGNDNIVFKRLGAGWQMVQPLFRCYVSHTHLVVNIYPHHSENLRVDSALRPHNQVKDRQSQLFPVLQPDGLIAIRHVQVATAWMCSRRMCCLSQAHLRVSYGLLGLVLSKTATYASISKLTALGRQVSCFPTVLWRHESHCCRWPGSVHAPRKTERWLATRAARLPTAMVATAAADMVPDRAPTHCCHPSCSFKCVVCPCPASAAAAASPALGEAASAGVAGAASHTHPLAATREGTSARQRQWVGGCHSAGARGAAAHPTVSPNLTPKSRLPWGGVRAHEIPTRTSRFATARCAASARVLHVCMWVGGWVCVCGCGCGCGCGGGGGCVGGSGPPTAAACVRVTRFPTKLFCVVLWFVDWLQRLHASHWLAQMWTHRRSHRSTSPVWKLLRNRSQGIYWGSTRSLLHMEWWLSMLEESKARLFHLDYSGSGVCGQFWGCQGVAGCNYTDSDWCICGTYYIF